MEVLTHFKEEILNLSYFIMPNNPCQLAKGYIFSKKKPAPKETGSTIRQTDLACLPRRALYLFPLGKGSVPALHTTPP